MTTIGALENEEIVAPAEGSSQPSLQVEKKPLQAWQRLNFESNNFSIDLPKQPEHIHQVITIPKTNYNIEYDTYISEPSDKIVYVISVWKYPDEIDMSKPDINLESGFNGMLKALPADSEVIKMDMSEEDGMKTLEFLVKTDEIFFRGKLLLVQNTLYQIFTVYKKGVDADETFDHFIDSFRLNNKEEVKTKEGAKVLKINL